MEKVILFDLDGTLIDSTKAIVSTFNHTFKKRDFNFKGDDEDIKSLIGYPLDMMFKDLGVDQSHVWDFVDTYKQRYKIISKEQTKLLNYAKEAVRLASSFARLSIVTTKTGIYSEDLLEHLELMKYFEFVTGREHVQNPKPHPEPILKTLNRMNIINNGNVWMVGDTKLDLIAAKEAGVNSVGVLCGYGKEDTLKTYTQNIAKNSYEAVKLIKKL